MGPHFNRFIGKGARGENGGRRVAPALAQTSSPAYSGSGPRAAATGRGVWGGWGVWGAWGWRFSRDSRGEILLTFSPPSLALSICQAQRAASLSRSPSERDDKSAESRPPSLPAPQQAGIAAQETRDRYCLPNTAGAIMKPAQSRQERVGPINNSISSPPLRGR